MCIWGLGCKKKEAKLGENLSFKTFNFNADTAFSTNDNCFILVNYSIGNVAKIDASGNLLWEKRNLFQGFDYKNRFPGKNYITVKQFGDSVITVWEIVLDYPHLDSVCLKMTKLDAQGNLQFKKDLFIPGSTYDFYYTDAMQLPNGNFIFKGDRQFTKATNPQLVLLIYDSKGMYLNSNIVGSVSPPPHVGSRMLSYQDSGFWILHDYGASTIKAYRFNLAGASVGGPKIIKSSIPAASGPLEFTIDNITSSDQKSDGSCFILGILRNSISTLSGQQFTYNYFGATYSNSFDSIISPLFITTASRLTAGGILTNHDGNFVLLGSETLGSSGFLNLISINSADLTLSQSVVNSELDDTKGLAGIVNSDGSFSVVGSFNIYNERTNTFFIKLNSDGTLQE